VWVRGRRMSAVVCWMVVCLLCSVGVGCCPAAAAAADVGSSSGEASPLGSTLVVPGSPTESEQLVAQEQAEQANPEAPAAREASETAYEGLNAEAGEKLAGETYPRLIEEAAGGPPPLDASEVFEGFATDNAMQVLHEGKHAIVESLQPIALDTPSGRVPIDLSLREAGGGFEPTTPDAGARVRIGKRLGEGATLSDVGVSLTPVDEHGSALEGEGAPDHAGVFYGDSEASNAGVHDLDTFVKPLTFGFMMESVLRSKRSPQKLFFKVGLPEGASLVQDGSGAVRVMDAGQPIAQFAVPAARDAEGRFVPLALSASGDIVAVTVARSPGEYKYPLIVDPFGTAEDTQLTGANAPTNWHFCTSVSPNCNHTEWPFASSGWGRTGGLSDYPEGSYGPGSFAEFIYKTQGESKIFEATTTTEATNNENGGRGFESNIETSVQLANESGTVNAVNLLSASKNYPPTANTIRECTSGCPALENHDALRFMQAATASGEHFHDRMTSASVKINQYSEPQVTPDTTDQYLLGGKWLNVLYGKGAWLGPNSGALGFTAEDKGIGLSDLGLEAWFNEEPWHETWFDKNLLAENKCSGVQCPQKVTEELTYNPKMLDGEHNVDLRAQDAAGVYGGVFVKLKVDSTSPTGLRIMGLPCNGFSCGPLKEAPYHLIAQATDGSATTPSSGIKSLELGIDGREIPGGKSGSCEPGPCGVTGEWTLNTEEFGVGKHWLRLEATDNAGNKQAVSYEITIRHDAPLAAGPGSVDPITGALSLTAHDVSITDGFGVLGVSRSYDSRRLSAGQEGPLGPQWSLAISGEQGIEAEPVGGSVDLVGPDGSRTTFASDGKGGFISPQGDENLQLSAEREGEAVKAYLLKDQTKGTTLRFIHPSGASASNLWVIEKAEGALSKTNGEQQTYAWEALEEEGMRIERPTRASAPGCPAETNAGCRSLIFSYDTETTATGEAPSEWGHYKGRLSKVSFKALPPGGTTFVTTAVAQYLYDKQGRLRAEWDPRISPALKTTYGYDPEGHVTAISPPGQEPWLFRYGTTATDPAAAGRLLSATRPSASTALASGGPPSNESKPTLSSGTPAIGTTLSVASNGSWSNSPLSYSYQWKDCDAKGENCAAIPGAVNQGYTPQARDAGYTLVATVTALNADGSGTASTAPSAAIALSAPKYAWQFGGLGEGAGQLKNPNGVAIDAAGHVWVSDHNNNRLDEFTAAPFSKFVETVGYGVANGERKLEVCTSSCRAGLAGSGEGQLSAPDGIAISGEDIYIADAANNRIQELSTKGEFVRAFGTAGAGLGQLQNPVAVAMASGGNVWVADRANNRIDEFTETGSYLASFGTSGSEAGQFKEPAGIAFSDGYAYVVDAGNSRVQELTLSGSYVTQFGSAGSGNGQFSGPAQIATEPVSGDLYVADSGNNRVQEFNQAGTFLASVGGAGEGEGQFKGVEGVAVTASGNLYAADLNNNRVQQFTPTYSTNNPAPSPPSVGSSAVTTIEYGVPLSGSELPTMTEAAVGEWAQKDDPVEATAIFPPDEPMGWPAQHYKRASISYFDSQGREVNVVSPTGGVSTREYNETNEVIRSLTPANRAEALKEGAKSKEVSELLDTKSKYNGETKAEKEREGWNASGMRLLETWGPQHTVKLSSGG